MKKPARSLQIRRKQPKHKVSVEMELIKSIVDKELAPMREQMLILKHNSQCAGVILRDICRSADLAHSLSASVKVRLEEYFTHINASAVNLDNYLEIADEDLPQQVDLTAFEEDWGDEREGPASEDGDDIMENVSDDEEWGL